MMMKLCLKFQFFVLHKDLNKKCDGKSIRSEIWVTTCKGKIFSSSSKFLFPEGFLKDCQSVKCEIWDATKITSQNIGIPDSTPEKFILDTIKKINGKIQSKLISER